MSSFGVDLYSDRTGGDPNYKLDVGNVLGRTFSTWASNLVPFFLVGVVVFLPVLLGHAVMGLLDIQSPGLTLTLTLVQNVLGLVLIGAITYGVFVHVRGEKAELGEVLRKGFSRLGSVWVVGLLSGILIGLGFCALIVPGLILLTRYWLAMPVAVIESPGIWPSMKRSEDLTEGNRWPIFAVVLIMGMINLVGSLALGVLIGLLPISRHTVAGRSVLSPLGSALVTLVTIPLATLAAVAPALGYHDLRVGREGADVEELLSVFD